MTLNQIIEKLKAYNPEPYCQTNGVKYKMEGDELEAYYTASAQVIFEQNQKDFEIATKATARQAVLNRLGLTEEEAQLILGGSN